MPLNGTGAAPVDLALFRAFVDGDLSARNQMLEIWAPIVLGWCMRLCGPKVDPQDAAQDVLIIVLTRGHTCRNPSRFDAWVRGVVRKVLASHRNKAWVRNNVGMPPRDGADPHPGPCVLAQQSQTRRRVDGVLGALKPKDRQVLMFHDWEGHSASECGKRLGTPTGTVKSRVRRARARFLDMADKMGLRESFKQPLMAGR